jgi:hypothetical protein
MKGCKGELTTQQIVMLIIVITSFAVVLFFLFRLNLGRIGDKEICHNSVIMRGSSAVLQGVTPLNCRTSYVCLSEDGTCEEMTNPDIKKVKTDEEVYEVLADEMADCWWMFGEGKVNYIGKEVKPSLHCSICSQITFDNSLEKIFDGKEFEKRKLYEYLEDKEMSGKKISYLSYLFGTNLLSEVNLGEFGKINFENNYYVIMGISSDISSLEYLGGGGILGLVLGGPIGAIIGGVGGKIVSLVVEGVSGDDYIIPTIIEVNSEDYNALKCEDVKTLA